MHHPNDSQRTTVMPIKQLLNLALCALAASMAQAEVTVTNSAAVVSDRTTGTAGVTEFSATIAGWSLNGGNAVAVFFTAEATNTFSATYGGQTMNIVEIDNGSAPYHLGALNTQAI